MSVQVNQMEDLNSIVVLNEVSENSQKNKHKQPCSKFYLNLNYARRHSALGSLQKVESCGSLQQAPSNMMRRWSQHISLYAKDKQTIQEKIQRRIAKRRLCIKAEFDSELDNNQIEELADEIGQYECLMKHNYKSQVDRLQVLRTLPQPLAVRRELKRRLYSYVEQQQWQSNLKRKLLKYSKNVLRIVFNWFKIVLRNLLLWQIALHEIGAHFGCDAKASFNLIRHLFVMNTCTLLLLLSFIGIPQFLYNLKHDHNLLNFMFYGDYNNAEISIMYLWPTYNINKAYFFINCVIYICTFIWTSLSMATVYRKYYVSTHEGYRKYAHNLFCAWDYRIATAGQATNRHHAICQNFQKMLETHHETPQKSNNIFGQMKIYSLEAAQHLVVAFILLLSCMLLKIVCNFIELFHNTMWLYWCLGLFINTLILMVQSGFMCFSFITHHAEQPIIIVRTFIVHLCLLGTLLEHWAGTRSRIECWEQQLAHLIWSISLADVTFSIIIMPLLFLLGYGLLLRFKIFSCQVLVFNITHLNINILYAQTLLWLGLLYAPALVLVLLFKLLGVFYIQKYLLFRYSRILKTCSLNVGLEGIQMVLIFISLLCVLCVHAYVITHFKVSKLCGPFNNYTYMFEMLLHGNLGLNSQSTLGRFLFFIVRPGGVLIMLLLLCIKVYYVHAKSKAQCKMALVLREMLKWEVRDKRFLLAQLKSVQYSMSGADTIAEL